MDATRCSCLEQRFSGVRKWIKDSRASTSASVRGGSYNVIFLDEFAFIPNHIGDQFFASVYPTISSGQRTKVIVVSTPHGMNHFYRMWHDVKEKRMNMYQLRFIGLKCEQRFILERTDNRKHIRTTVSC